MTSAIITEAQELSPIYKHPLLLEAFVAPTGGSIWVSSDTKKSSSVFVFHGLSKVLEEWSVVKNSKSLFKTTNKFTESKLTKMDLVKMAQGPSIKLPDVPLPKDINEFNVGTASVSALMNWSDELFSQNYAPNSLVGYDSKFNTHGFDNPLTTEAFAKAYYRLALSKENFIEKLTPAQKGKLTSKIKLVKILYWVSALAYKANTFKDYDAYILESETERAICELARFHFADTDSGVYVYVLDSITKKFLKSYFFNLKMNLPFNIDKEDNKDVLLSYIKDNMEYKESFSFLSADKLRLLIKAALKFPNLGPQLPYLEQLADFYALMHEVAKNAEHNLNLRKNYPWLKFDSTVHTAKAVTLPYHMSHMSKNIEIPVGSLISKKGDSYRVYQDIIWFILNEDKLYGYPEGFDAKKAHAVDLSCGWEDVTPLWTSVTGVYEKPNDVSQLVWDFVIGAEFGGKAFAKLIGNTTSHSDQENINYLVSCSYNYPDVTTQEIFAALSGREALKKLLVFISKIRIGEDLNFSYTKYIADVLQEIVVAIKALTASGLLLHPDNIFWYNPLTKKDMLLPYGCKVFYDGNNIIYVEISDNLYFYGTSAYDPKNNFTWYFEEHSLDTNEEELKLLFTAPENFAIDKAYAEGWEFSKEAYEAVELAEVQTEWTFNGLEENAAAYNYKLAVANLPVSDFEPYEGITSKMYAFPVGIKQLLLESALTADLDKLEVILWKISKKAYAVNLIENKIDPTKPYASFVDKGMISFTSIHDDWLISNINMLLDDFKVVHAPDADLSELSKLAAAKLLEIKKSAAVSASADASQDTAQLDLSPISKNYGGMHTKQGYADQFGNEWMAKFYASDKNAQYRCDAEHYGNVLGRTFGFNNPQTFVRTIDGNYNILQSIVANNGTLKNHTPYTLNLSQLTNVMQEHVLDWWISNHDSWGDNLLLNPDGKTIIGIDKGQAFKHSHDDQLAVGYLPSENPIPVWYDQFYDGVKTKQISYDIANKVANKVLLKAFQVQNSQDERAYSLIESAMSKRTIWPSGYDKEKYTKLILDRKTSLLADFTKLYQSIFAVAGYEWAIDVEAFGKNVGDAFISNSSIFAETVLKSSVHGTALLFNSRDIEDTHIMFTPMKQTAGGVCLLGSAKIRDTADAELTAWLKARLNVNSVDAPIKPKKIVNNDEVSDDLPLFYAYVTALINYVKTIKTHVDDKQYNKDTLKAVENYKKSVENLMSAIDDREDYFKTVPEFTTLEQQEFWYTSAENLLSIHKILDAAKEAGKTVKQYAPNLGNIEYVTYTPSEDLVHNSKAEIKEHFLVNYVSYYSTTDGGFLKIMPDPVTVKIICKEDFVLATKDKVAVAKETEVLEEIVEAEQDVQIAGKQMQVARRKAAQHGGALNYETGKLIEESENKQYFQSGYEYTVSYDNVKIHYRPWKDEEVYKAQQGQLAIEVRNWDGGHEAIDDVLDTLGLMGIDVTPADAQSLELFYWRQLTAIIKNRISTTKTTKILNLVNDAKIEKSKLDTEQELEVLKNAWQTAYSQDLVSSAYWKPRFDTAYGQIGGRPYWLRPDFSIKELKKIYGSNLPKHTVINHSSYAGRLGSAIDVLKVGKLLSTEERPRILGQNISGMSSVADQMKGSSAFVFTRQNSNMSAYTGEPYIIINPTVSLRNTTYMFNQDFYGEITYRNKYSPFELNEACKFSQSGNEMMVKNSADVLFLIVGDSSERIKVLKGLKEEKIETVNGRPIEEVVFTGSEWDKLSINKIEEAWTSLIESEVKLRAENE